MKTTLFCVISFFTHTTLLAVGIEFKTLNYTEAGELAKKENKFIFIDVYIENCAPCKYLAEKIFTQEHLGIFMNEHFVSIKLNPNSPENSAFKKQFTFNSFPTLLFIAPNGELIRTIHGSKEADVILRIANDVVFPESSVLFKLQKKYNEGNRDKFFLRDLIFEVMENDLSTAQLIKEYTDIYGVDFEDEIDLKIWMNGDMPLNSPLVIKLLENISHYYEVQPDRIKKVVTKIVDQMVREAVKAKEYSLVESKINSILFAYQVVLDPDTNFDKLNKKLRSKFDDLMFWGAKQIVVKEK